MSFKFMLFLFILLSPGLANADVMINEIMYAPNTDWGGQDNEWIELFNNGTEDESITGWIIDGKPIPDASISAGGYIILAKNSTKFQQIYGISSVHVAFTYGLKNTGEILNLSSNGVVVNVFDYTPYANLAVNNNHTLELNVSGWFESTMPGGTPGAQNSILTPESPPEQDEPLESQNRNADNQEKPQIEIMHSPSSMKFGDFGTVQLMFYSGDKSFSKMRFVAYVYSPNWISRDLSRNETTLRNAPYNSGAAAAAENIGANMTLNVILPLYLKCNPEGKYADVIYTLRVRGYSFKDGSWSDIAEKDAQISVSGENELCEKEECKSESSRENRTEKESCGSEELESGIFDANITAPVMVFFGRNFTTTIFLKNKANVSLDLEIYSYIYEHSTIMSQGWSGEKWGNARTANSKKVSLSPNDSETVELLNMPRENIGAEKYTFKVQIDDLNNVKNSRDFISLLKVENAPEGDKEETVINESGKSEEDKITANVIGKNSDISFWEKIIEKIKSWLKR